MIEAQVRCGPANSAQAVMASSSALTGTRFEPA